MAAEHAATVHGMKEIPKDLLAKAKTSFGSNDSGYSKDAWAATLLPERVILKCITERNVTISTK